MEWHHVLTIVGSNLVLLGGAIGITISLFMHMDNKSEKRSKEANDILRAIQEEMKDFHGRLCAIEERRNK